MDDPLETVYALVERSYMRLQAGDILIRCLEEGSTNPIQNMVEGLVLAGPQSLEALREILAEVGQRKSQVQDDILQVFSDLKRVLSGYGVRLNGINKSLAVTSLAASGLLRLMRQQGITDDDTQTTCLHLLQESRDLITNLNTHLSLLQEVEAYLQDWLWGIAYQSARQGTDPWEAAQTTL